MGDKVLTKDIIEVLRKTLETFAVRFVVKEQIELPTIFALDKCPITRYTLYRYLVYQGEV